MKLNHPILEESFAIIDQIIGEHQFKPEEYAIIRRVIHATADLDFTHLLYFSPTAIESAIASLREGIPIITDVTMVKQGIVNMAKKTFNNPIIAAVETVSQPITHKTLTETGLLKCWQQYPDAIYAIGNAPTALLALCAQLTQNTLVSKPRLIIGAPVGFVKVIESKQALAKIPVPQIRVEGRKGGSPVAASIINALFVLATDTN